jgi:hypothetical protein
MSQETQYFTRLAAAYVRGRLNASMPADLLDTPLEELSEAQLDAVIAAGQEAGLRLHHFKRTMGLPRVAGEWTGAYYGSVVALAASSRLGKPRAIR